MKVFLSIDWDFFPAFPGAFPGYPTTTVASGQKLPNLLLYDWGQSEGHSDSMSSWLWHHRAAELQALHGLSLEREFTLRPGLSTDLIEFQDMIVAACDGPASAYAEVHWAESHAFAYRSLDWAVGDGCEPVTVWHFDAHHDLGYRAKGVRNLRREGKASCEDWLLAAFDSGLTEEAHIVYPDWRELDEWEGYEDSPWLPEGAKPTTWRAWREAEREPVEFVGCFVARSGAWTPPYLDPRFQDLLRLLRAGDNPLPVWVGDGDPLPVKRPWDTAEVERMAEALTIAKDWP